MSNDPSTTADPLAALDLSSLDVDSLFSALTSVEKAIPVLLGCVKPVLAQLSSSSAPAPAQKGHDGDDGGGVEAREAIARYTDLLDKIQFVLRQTVYYLHETKASSKTLIPPPQGTVPTPFASTLPVVSGSSLAGTHVGAAPGTDGSAESEGVELGLYGRRIEARTLREMADVLERWRNPEIQSEAEAGG